MPAPSSSRTAPTQRITPKSTSRNGVDYILNGEAEQTLADLCDASAVGRQHRLDIAGLVYRGENSALTHSAIASARNPDWVHLPRPARELIDMEPYRRAWSAAHGYFSTNVVSSRGCPYRCNWCAKPISGNKFHVRAPEEVAAEIRELKASHGVEHIWFGDDVFALNHHWVEDSPEKLSCTTASFPSRFSPAPT